MAVVQSALEADELNGTIKFSIALERGTTIRTGSLYLSLCFLDVNPGLLNDRREVAIRFQTEGQDLWVLQNPIFRNMTWMWWNYAQLLENDAEIDVLIQSTSNSTLPPLINAMEVYEEIQPARDRINGSLLAISEFVVSAFAPYTHDVDMSGDPCLPVPWPLLSCDSEYSDPLALFTLNLSNKGMEGELPSGFTPYLLSEELIFDLVDLSNNQFYGAVPASLLQVPSYNINLDSNLLSGFNFSSKTEDTPFPSFFQTISFNNNSFRWGDVMELLVNLPLHSTIKILSFSQNQLSGPMNFEVGHSSTLGFAVDSLDLSWNSLTGPIPPELLTICDLNLRGNQLTGHIGGVVKNVTTLGVWQLDLSYNSVSGTLPFDFFELPELWLLSLASNQLTGEFEVLATLRFPRGILDLSNNMITGVNLTTWCSNISSSEFKTKVSLVGNRIDYVILQENCEKRFSSSDAEAHERSWRATYYPHSRSNNERVLIIGLVCGGFLSVLIVCALLAQLWKLKRRSKALEEIAEAMAKEDVRPPFFKYEDLKTATDHFFLDSSLGQGAFGAVYKAVIADGSVVAVKLLFHTEQNIVEFLKEMVLITGIKHRNLLQLKGCCVRDRKRFLVYDFAENGNLAQALWGAGEFQNSQQVKLTWPQRLNIGLCVARGLAYLHEELQPKIIHRDVVMAVVSGLYLQRHKPQNILLDKNWNAKIADFGLARPVHEDATQIATTIGGTLGYFSPEYATLGFLSEKLDVYSYGVVLLEMISGRRCIDFSQPETEIYLRTHAFRLYSEDRLGETIEESLLETRSRDEILTVLKIALSCLNEDPAKRPTMSQIVSLLARTPADLAVEIVNELNQDHHSAMHRFKKILNGSSTLAKSRESEESALLNDHASSGSSER